MQNTLLSMLARGLQIFYRVGDLSGGGGGGSIVQKNFWEVKGLLSKTLTPFQPLV